MARLKRGAPARGGGRPVPMGLPLAGFLALVLAALATAPVACFLTIDDGRVGTCGDCATEDAAVEASVDAGASFCAAQRPVPFFCADFEQGPVSAVFLAGAMANMPAANLQGSLGLTTPGQGSTTALVATIPPSATVDQVAAVFPGDTFQSSNVGSARLRFDLRLDTFVPLANNERVRIASLILKAGGASIVAQFELTNAAAALVLNASDADGGSQTVPVAAPPRGAWVDVVLDLTLSPAPHVSLTMNRGAIVQELRAPPAFGTGRALISFGLNAYHPTAAATIAIDNVVFSTSP